MKSWKTTLTGVAAIAATIATAIWPDHAENITKLAAALVGLGLISARDNGVSSESAGAK
jgi:hypothetical protein